MMTTNNKIANASFFTAMMVVGIHTAGRQPGMFDGRLALWWLEAIGHYGVFAIAVPFFSFVPATFLPDTWKSMDGGGVNGQSGFALFLFRMLYGASCTHCFR